MTLREQIGQLFMMGFTGTTVTKDLASILKAYTPGGVIFFKRNLESVRANRRPHKRTSKTVASLAPARRDRSRGGAGVSSPRRVHNFPSL